VETETRGNHLGRLQNERIWLVLARPQFFAEETALFAIDWLKKGILIERETSILPSAAEAVAAAKMRSRDVAWRHPGQEPDTFRLVDATGRILGVFPKNPINQR
jgi:hypothetical protein